MQILDAIRNAIEKFKEMEERTAQDFNNACSIFIKEKDERDEASDLALNRICVKSTKGDICVE